MTKNEFYQHAILFNIFPNNFDFSSKKIRYFQFNERAFNSNRLPFQTFFRINKILKNDGATSILMRDYGVKLTIFLIY